MRKIIFEDGDGERVTLEGDFVQIGDLFQALKRMCLAVGYHPENVQELFGDCENWANEATCEKFKKPDELNCDLN